VSWLGSELAIDKDVLGPLTRGADIAMSGDYAAALTG
jgi:hypothetical protein